MALGSVKGKLNKLAAQGLHLLNGPKPQLAAFLKKIGAWLNKPPQAIDTPLNPLNTLVALRSKPPKQGGLAEVPAASFVRPRKEGIKGKKVLKAQVKAITGQRMNGVRGIAQ
jgi:hypothetical protein